MRPVFVLFLQVFLGFLIADFLTGFFHWIEDRYLPYEVSFPVLSEIAKENEFHHFFPRGITTSDFTHNSRVNVVLAGTLLALFWTLFPDTYHRYPVFFWTLLFFGTISNWVHKLIHYRAHEAPSWVTHLQAWGWMQSHEEHQKHHLDANKKYCILFPLQNILLDTIGFWSALEWILPFPTQHAPYHKYDALRKKLGVDQIKDTDTITEEDTQRIQRAFRAAYHPTGKPSSPVPK